MKRRLEGKVAIVTGGVSGMGLATVERFVAEGASVVFCDLSPDQMARIDERLGIVARYHRRTRERGGPHDGETIAARLGPRARFVPCDVTVREELERVVETALREFGGIDVLASVAGAGGREGWIVESEEETFDRMVAVNLKAPWMSIKLVAPHMQRRGSGAIVHVSSSFALRGFPGCAGYASAKAGLLGLTRAAAAELAPFFIRVNAICPGGVVTPMVYDPKSDASILSLSREEYAKVMASNRALPRAGEPEDVANAIVYLASDESKFVTAQTIIIDGGVTEFDPNVGNPLAVEGVRRSPPR